MNKNQDVNSIIHYSRFDPLFPFCSISSIMVLSRYIECTIELASSADWVLTHHNDKPLGIVCKARGRVIERGAVLRRVMEYVFPQKTPGGIVLKSPGCISTTMYGRNK